MDHASASFAASSPWAAVLGGHHSMGGTTNSEHGFGHHGLPMDLHVPQGYSYYRYRDDPFCWSERKPSLDDVNQASVVNTRILELRKEKSRDAARSRRGKENYEFYELAKMLPLPAAITSQLDKASIIRLTISYLKLRDFTGHGDPPWSREGSNTNKILKIRRTTASLALELFEQHQGTHILQSLDGFALAVAADGRFLYISETVSIYLGLSQVEMAGSSIFDYVHQADHAEVAEQLGLSLTGHAGMASPSSSEEGTSHGTMNPDVSSSMTLSSTSKYKGLERAFCVRMKSTLTKRGCHFKQSSGYRVVLMLCRLRPQYSFSHNRKSQPPLLGMVAIAIALPPPSVHEIRLECDMFVTRINFDFRIAHCEPKVTELLDYTPEELTGESLYTLCHGEDATKLRKCHMDLIEKGQVLTHYYRMMNKNGGYTWIQTCATIVCNTKNADEQNIICVNYVISGKENVNLIMDQCQLEIIKKEEKETMPIEKETRSPGNDPSNDGEQSSGNYVNESTKGFVKIETSMASSETKNSSSTNTGNSKKNTAEAKSDETPTRGRKRKNKLEVPEPIPKKQLSQTISGHMNENACKETQRQMNDEKDKSESSVKDLENAMSKHLPSPSTGSTTSDFSADSLLKHQEKDANANHWNAPPTTTSYSDSQQSPVMPATTLLRQLYANRESVIRATARPIPSSFVYSDNGTLPTPPGIEYNNESYNNLPTNYATTYSSNPAEYSSITPPNSVSPRDLSNLSSKTPTSSNYEYNSYPSQETILPLPLKPQPYSIHHHANYPEGQYFPHHHGFWYPTPS
ncbi:unnamed protein product [Diamesa tonsa]